MSMWIVKRADGSTSEAYSTYYPAEQEARGLTGAEVVYRGVRGLEVLVWPLQP